MHVRDTLHNIESMKKVILTVCLLLTSCETVEDKENTGKIQDNYYYSTGDPPLNFRNEVKQKIKKLERNLRREKNTNAKIRMMEKISDLRQEEAVIEKQLKMQKLAQPHHTNPSPAIADMMTALNNN